MTQSQESMTWVKGYEEVTKQLQSVVTFYKTNLELIDPKKFQYRKDQIPFLQKQIREIRSRFDISKCRLTSKDTDKSSVEIDLIKQAFWLNLVNYYTLLKMAEYALTKPGTLKKINSFAMWQTFWQYNKVKVSKIQISLYLIIFHLLRNTLSLPNFSIAMPEEQVDEDGKYMIVKKPDPLNFYGVFIPCTNF